MGYPTNDDPDLNKEYKQRGEKPGTGKRDAHRRQNPHDHKPQHPAQEDHRLVEQGERQDWQESGPEGRGTDEAGKPFPPTRPAGTRK